MLRRLLLFLSYSLHFFSSGDSDKERYYCQAGEHEWGDGRAERGSKRDVSVAITLSNGDSVLMAQYVTKGTQRCKRDECTVTRRVYQIMFVSSLKKEDLEMLNPKDRKRAQGGPSKWMGLSPGVEERINRLPR